MQQGRIGEETGMNRKTGGQGGIRTLGTLAGTHAFQACPIDRSGTCPTLQKSPLRRVVADQINRPDATNRAIQGWRKLKWAVDLFELLKKSKINKKSVCQGGTFR
jgi:hypothetical protein